MVMPIIITSFKIGGGDACPDKKRRKIIRIILKE
jgi:hypothetical protein